MIKNLLTLGLIAVSAVGCGERVQGEYAGQMRIASADNCSGAEVNDVYDVTVIMRKAGSVEFVFREVEGTSGNRGSDRNVAVFFRGQSFQAEVDGNNDIVTKEAVYDLAEAAIFENQRTYGITDLNSISEEEERLLTTATVIVEGDLGTDRELINSLRVDVTRAVPVNNLPKSCSIALETDRNGLALQK